MRIPAFLDRPPEVVPARIVAIRHAVAKLVAVRCGISEKSLATYKSAVRAALVWYAEKANISSRGTPLDESWSALSSAITNLRDRINLFALTMRLLSARQIPPRPSMTLSFELLSITAGQRPSWIAPRSRCARYPSLGMVAGTVPVGRGLPHRAGIAKADKGPGLGGVSCGLSC